MVLLISLNAVFYRKALSGASVTLEVKLISCFF